MVLRAPPLSLLDEAALLLDFDGTLVDLAETPGAIRVGDHVAPLLDALAERLEGRIAIVTGRSIDDLERHLDVARFTVSGSHGHELRFKGCAAAPGDQPPGLSDARAAAYRFAAARDGLLVEAKPFGVALHYRRAPGEKDAVLAFMRSLAADTGLALQTGHMLAELRAPGIDKGTAVRAIMTEPGFAGARPVFVGDDRTDEHAFAAAAELGGAGILVGAPRDTAAAWRLDDAAAVAAWLSEATAF